MVNTAIPLIVGSFHVPTSCNDEQCSGMNEICYPTNNKESRSINGNPVSSFTEKSDGSTSEPNSESDKQKRPTRKISSTQKKLDVKRCDESSEEQTESEDMEIPRESNASLQCSDTVPPPWFTEYMEAVSDIVNRMYLCMLKPYCFTDEEGHGVYDHTRGGKKRDGGAEQTPRFPCVSPVEGTGSISKSIVFFSLETTS